MSEPRLSPATKALLRAARSDGPSAAARAKVWAGVSGAVGGAAGAAGAAAGASAGGGAGALLAGGTSATKMLAMGTLLGGTVTVGLATLLLRIAPVPTTPSSHPSTVEPVRMAAAPSRPAAIVGEPDIPTAPVDAVPVFGPSFLPALASAPPASPASPRAVPVFNPTLEADRLLTQEAALVTEAREALLRGDPQRALRAVRAARVLPSHRLAPEELSVESQALRALGREDDARDTDSTLRKQFPESALAR